MINFIVWLIAGAVIGWSGYFSHPPPPSDPAAQYHCGQHWCFPGWLLVARCFISTQPASVSGLLVSLGGAIILLVVVNFSIREHNVKNSVIKNQWNQVRDKIHIRWAKYRGRCRTDQRGSRPADQFARRTVWYLQQGSRRSITKIFKGSNYHSILVFGFLQSCTSILMAFGGAVLLLVFVRMPTGGKVFSH